MTRFYSSTAQPTTLSAACTNSATTIQVTATTGFPAVEFILALDYGGAAQELVKVTAVAGTTLTVVRGFDSTTAQAHSLGAAVQHVHSADDFRLSRTHEAASSGVHGATGAVVGTTDAQALSNKDLTAGTNTFPTSLATAANLTAHTGATAAHGTAGAVVGTTDAQALSNKDLTAGTNTFPTSLATLTGIQTLTNKTLDLTSNTVTMTKAQLNTAVTDADVATIAGTETLTNKTLTAPAMTAPTASGSLAGFGGAWTAYTPSFSATSGTPSIGNGTSAGRYIQVGKTVIVEGSVSFGTTSNVGTGAFRVGLPVAANAAGVNGRIGFLTGYNSNTGEVCGPFYVVMIDVNTFGSEYPASWPKGAPVGVGGGTGAQPWLWVAGQSSFNFVLVYEAA